MNFVVKNTKRKGRGVFAKKSFEKGEFVKTLSGERLRSSQVDERIRAGIEAPNDPLQISRLMYIDLDEPSRLINHSCDPNCGIRQENKLYALRNINAGEEISYDYSTTVPKYKSWWTMRCFCKAKKCRKIISSFDRIPKAQQSYYLSLRVLPLWVRKFRTFIEE